MPLRPDHGIHAAIATPVEADGSISIERYIRQAHALLQQGCHGLGIFGTTGEATSFAVADRQAALEALIEGGVPAERLMPGIGTCAKTDTVALARHALAQGCMRVLMQPPFFYKGVSDEGVYAAFAELIDAVADDRLELYLYHFPQATQIPINKPVIERLVAAYPQTLRGIKDSSGDLAHTTDLARSFPSLAIYAGADSHLLDLLAAGGAGTVSAAANINSAANRTVLDAYARGDETAAR